MAISRQTEPELPDSVRKFGNLTLDLALWRATVEGRPVELTRHELDLLHILMGQPDRVLPYRSLVISLWGESTPASLRHLNVVVHRLRAKLARSSPYTIETVRGRGYGLLKAHASESAAS